MRIGRLNTVFRNHCRFGGLQIIKIPFELSEELLSEAGNLLGMICCSQNHMNFKRKRPQQARVRIAQPRSLRLHIPGVFEQKPRITASGFCSVLYSPTKASRVPSNAVMRVSDVKNPTK